MKAKGALTKVELNNVLEMQLPEMKTALPEHINPEKIKRIVLTEFGKNPRLANCTQNSILRSVMEACQFGLEPNSVTGTAYLIPYKRGGVEECQLQIGYKGLLKLAYQAGVQSINSFSVREHDDFALQLGTEPTIYHRPNMGERGQLIGVYAIADMGQSATIPKFEFMSVNECREVMLSTPSKGANGPWKTHFESMCLKTVLRTLCKTLPQDSERLSWAVDHKEGKSGLQYDLDTKDWTYVDEESANSQEVQEDDAITT